MRIVSDLTSLLATSLATSLATLLASGPAFAAETTAEADHREFDAVLEAPFHAGSDGKHHLTLHFSYPDQQRSHRVRWRLDLLSGRGRGLRHWQGVARLEVIPRTIALTLSDPPPADSSRPPPARLPAGVHRLRLRASARPLAGAAEAGATSAQPPATIEQSWEIALGRPRPLALPAFAPLPGSRSTGLPAPASQPAPDLLPYTVYFGNLHSQTNHSDGGGSLEHCTGAQAPQSAALGPADAYAYAQQHGLDFLLTSEHNHMYDGSDGSNPDASPAAAIELYQSGLRQAAGYRAAHPEFLALYGQEWGVINHGGHLNIFNSPALLGWERNGNGELLAELDTARGDYAALYTLMRERGWLGQFNHPQGGQFLAAGKPFGYTPDGEQAMVLCEVMNSNAFSSRSDETEPRRSNYEPACQQLLEAGYRLAFSSDQDNHCANWGASYSNRTGVLIPNGTPLDQDSLMAALRARRVYATMDKDSQLILSANGHLMGERFDNSGKLVLSVRHASAAGRQAAALAVFHGVPGRNGTVELLSSSADTVLTPAPGEHFYYARLTQDDGKMLWSAPLWVSQQASSYRALHKNKLR